MEKRVSAVAKYSPKKNGPDECVPWSFQFFCFRLRLRLCRDKSVRPIFQAKEKQEDFCLRLGFRLRFQLRHDKSPQLVI